MKRIINLLFIILITIIVGASCASNSGAYYGAKQKRTSYSKKNKNFYHQKFSNKPRSTRKDYVIKNGIAH